MDFFVFNAKIITNAKQFKVCGFNPNNELCIRVREKPSKGKANNEIERELRKKLKTSVEVVKGIHSNKKTIKIGLEKKLALERIKAGLLN